MLFKLQRKTLVKSQIIGYALTIFVGVSILLLTIQFYLDVKPLLTEQTKVFKNNSAVISKNVSVFKTMNKQKIYFTDEEIKDLKNQSFIKSVSIFNSANFKIKAYSDKMGNIPVFYTDLFFESIPTTYLDVETKDWIWNSSLDFIPIIIPENYLSLYNFGFAESQGLPVLSKSTISQIEFNIQVKGNYKSRNFRSRIVGFSNKINSILVPEEFLSWANKTFGNSNNSRISRLLLEFNNPSDKLILKYFNEHNYAINKDKLEFSKLSFLFKLGLLFVFSVAVIVVVLSISFIILSVNLIIQKNRDLFINLYSIGFEIGVIAKFYYLLVGFITVISIILSVVITFYIRNYYTLKFVNLFDMNTSYNSIFLLGFLLIIILLILYKILINRILKNILLKKV